MVFILVKTACAGRPRGPGRRKMPTQSRADRCWRRNSPTLSRADRCQALKMGVFSELVLHIMFGTIFGPILGSFWDSIWVQKSIQKPRADSTPFPMSMLDHFGSKFGYILVSLWRELSRERDFRGYSKTIKKPWFFNGFAMSEVSEKQRKPSRGEVAAGLSAHIRHDTQICQILIPKWLQNWSQNGIRNCLKIELLCLMLFGAKRGPKMEPKWNQNCSQV